MESDKNVENKKSRYKFCEKLCVVLIGETMKPSSSGGSRYVENANPVRFIRGVL